MQTLSALAGRRSRDLHRVYRPINNTSATTRQNPLFISSSSSFSSRERDGINTPTPTGKVLLLYKGPNVKLFRAIVRFKLLQVFSIGAVSTPLLLVFGGGDGGNIIIKGNANLWTLQSFRFKKHFKAGNGGDGGGSRKSGISGEDIIIDVPLGTIIKNTNTDKIFFEINEDKLEIILLK